MSARCGRLALGTLFCALDAGAACELGGDEVSSMQGAAMCAQGAEKVDGREVQDLLALDPSMMSFVDLQKAFEASDFQSRVSHG